MGPIARLVQVKVIEPTCPDKEGHHNNCLVLFHTGGSSPLRYSGDLQAGTTLILPDPSPSLRTTLSNALMELDDWALAGGSAL